MGLTVKYPKFLTNSRKSHNLIETFKNRNYILLSIYSNSYSILRVSVFPPKYYKISWQEVYYFSRIPPLLQSLLASCSLGGAPCSMYIEGFSMDTHYFRAA